MKHINAIVNALQVVIIYFHTIHDVRASILTGANGSGGKKNIIF